MGNEHDDYAVEPMRGLPEMLPEGETLLWQGAPAWKTLAWRVFHIREGALYFAVLMGWKGFSTWWESGQLAPALAAMVPVLIPASIGLGLLALLAWLTARTSVYTLTSKRLVMRIGIALPTTFNLPFTSIIAADAKIHAPGTGDKATGDISVRLSDENRLAYLVLWPHTRPWHVRRTEPMLRAVPDAAKVANRLAEALQASLGEASRVQRVAQTAPRAKSAQGGQKTPVSTHSGLTSAA